MATPDEVLCVVVRTLFDSYPLHMVIFIVEPSILGWAA